MTTLLEKAKEYKGRKLSKATDEEIELAFAWIRDEICFTSLCHALDLPPAKGGNVLYRVAVWLRDAYREGRLEIKEEK